MSNDLRLDEFAPSDSPMMDLGMEMEDKTATDLAPVASELMWLRV